MFFRRFWRSYNNIIERCRLIEFIYKKGISWIIFGLSPTLHRILDYDYMTTTRTFVRSATCWVRLNQAYKNIIKNLRVMTACQWLTMAGSSDNFFSVQCSFFFVLSFVLLVHLIDYVLALISAAHVYLIVLFWGHEFTCLLKTFIEWEYREEMCGFVLIFSLMGKCSIFLLYIRLLIFDEFLSSFYCRLLIIIIKEYLLKSKYL